MSIGTKAGQFLAVVFVLPLVLILGILNGIGRETIGTIIGTVVGYLLSDINKD